MEFVVIGLGRFGGSIAVQLAQSGHAILGLDPDPDRVQQLADEVTHTVALDPTDEDALRSVGVSEFHTAIVAMDEDFESTVLVTSLLKDMGLRRIVCQALTERQKAILLRVGAHEVILPEREAGFRLARHLTSPYLLDWFELEPGIHVSEVRLPAPLRGHSLRELDLPGRFGLIVLLIKGKRLLPAPHADEVLRDGDVLVLIGPEAGVNRLQTWHP